MLNALKSDLNGNGKLLAFITFITSTFIQSAVQLMLLIHTHTHRPMAIGHHARHQPARQVRCHAQGHFETPKAGSNLQPSDCQTTALTSRADVAPFNSVFIYLFLKYMYHIKRLRIDTCTVHECKCLTI